MKKLLIFATLLSVLILSCLTCQAAGLSEETEGVIYQSLLADNASDRYAPEDESSVTQLIAEAVRLHGIYNSSGIEDSYDKEAYKEYALENGLIYDGLFDDYDRGATRAEAVYVISNAVPSQLLTPEINTVVLIPDCDPSAGYYQPVMSFYKAGIVTGYDKYGAFRPGAAITNKDFSDMLHKLVNPALRQQKDFEEYESDAAYYLIDDFLMSLAVRNISNIASGWRYDYTGSLEAGVESAYTNKLRDISAEDNISISRQIFPQKDGVLVLEVLLSVSGNYNGITVSLDDAEDIPVFTLGTENNRVYGMCEGGTGKIISTKSISSLAESSGMIRVRMEFDLNNNTASAYVGGNPIGNFNLVDGYKSISKVTISTGIEQVTTLDVNNVHLYRNYAVNDVMRVENIGSKPFGYTTTGNITVRTIDGSNNSSTGDINSAKIIAYDGENANAHKEFAETEGLVKLEAYMLLPTENDGAYFTASYKDYPVFKIETKDGKFFYGDRELYDFSANIWQNIHVEANTNTQTFLLRINGKKIADNLPFMNNVPAFDNLDIGITPDEDCTMWFDDVEVHAMFEHEDYVPVPDKLETDYYVSMSVCNLWRNGSHYGWDYIAPHDDLIPYTGFYDEGLPESMDWEIKFLAEHGVAFYNMCWYAPACPQKNPIKKPRMVDAFHDGYFNAKYSDMLDFTIMFENASFRTAESYESFVNNVWPFWVEWYLSDERYFKIDNKPFLVIYQYANWIEMCYEKPVTDSMTSEEKNEIHANAIVRAKALFDMMEQDMIDLGYDGLIMTFTNRGNTQKIADECNAIGAAGVFPYNWGSAANDLSSFKTTVESTYESATKYNIDLLAVGGIGFNHIGWKLERWPLMTPEEFEELLLWFRDDYLKRYSTKYANDPENIWKSKFIQFATWNEYGEGHYLYPTNLNGFGYLDAIAEVFGSEEHDKSIDVMPTDAQKTRIGRLYPGYRHYIRRQYYVKEDPPIPDVVEKSYDFTQYNSISNLGISSSNFNPKLAWSLVSGNIVNGTATYALKGTSSSTDPMMSWKLAEPINAKAYDAVHVRLSVTKPATNGTVYFRTDNMTTFVEDYKLTFDILETGVQDYYIPTIQNPLWDGTITHLRIDPGSFTGNEICFYNLELMNYSDETKGLTIYIDGAEYFPVSVDEIRSFDKKEVYIAATEEDHFYRQMHIVYDWNIHTGKLRLETPNETVFEFEIGSETVYVNGKAKTLDKKFEIYDGCPVLPLLFVLDNAEYRYVYDYTSKNLEIYELDVSTIFEDLDNGDAENEYSTGTFYNYVGGVNLVQRTVDPEDETNHVWLVEAAEGKSWSYFRANMKFEAGKTYTVDFDFKLGKLNNGGVVQSEQPINVNPRYANTSQLETATNNYYDHPQKAGTARYSSTNGWVHVSHTFTVAEDYITTDLDGNTYVDSINIFINPVGNYGFDYYVDNFTVRSKVSPFLIVNGDAESDDTSMIMGTTTTIETETLSDGTQNRYWKATSDVTNKEAWTYFNQYTEYTVGATYYFEVDVKIGQNVLGHDVSTIVTLNSRYTDSLQAHFDTNPKEHTVNLGKFTTGEDWRHCQGSFTVSRGYSGAESGYKPLIAFFANPAAPLDGSSTDKRAVELMLDNFKAYTVKPAHFED